MGWFLDNNDINIFFYLYWISSLFNDVSKWIFNWRVKNLEYGVIRKLCQKRGYFVDLVFGYLLRLLVGWILLGLYEEWYVYCKIEL